MTISNVVLCRDKLVVCFDTADLEGVTRPIAWIEGVGWLASSYCSNEGNINDLLKGVPWAGLSLENLSMRTESSPDQEPTPDYYNKTFKGVKFDPYRVCKMYDINGGPREHIVKKMLRGINKDDGINTELDLINVVEGQLRRWKEMIKEDAE